MKVKYVGYDSSAKKISGTLDARDAQDARAQLRAQGIRASQLVAIQGGGGGTNSGRAGTGGLTSVKKTSFSLATIMSSSKPKPTEFAASIRQLSVMQGAGIPIVQALQILGEAVETKGYGRTLIEVRGRVESGQGFADALKVYPTTFDRIFVNLAAAGEVSGSLDQILLRLAQYYEKSNTLRRKVISAMTYPAFMLVVMIAVISVMLIWVVPTFAEMFQAQGKELPAATQFVVDMSNNLRRYWWAYLGAMACFGWFISFLFSNEPSRRQIDPVLIKIPVLGDLITKVAVARFSRTFGTLVQSGVPILEALEITAKVAGNFAVEDAILDSRAAITQGNSLSVPLARAGVFPKMAVSMIMIGEQTGALDAMLTKIADFYEEEVDTAVTALTSVMEPIMIVVVGVTVASILIPMYLPIFKMADTVGG